MALWEKYNEQITTYGTKIGAFLLVLVLGWWLANYAVRLVEKALQKSKIDLSIHGFLKSMASFFLKLMVLITAATLIGVPVTTFIAMLSAAGLAIGLALKDSLSNFAAGILLLVFRPFSVGDYIEAGSIQGTVLTIQLLHTSLNTPDNRRVMVPNNSLVTSHIINYSVEPFRRIDKVYSVAYGSDVEQVKEILLRLAVRMDGVLDEKGVIVGVSRQNAYSLDFDYKVWVKREDYLAVGYALNEMVLGEFSRHGIAIPYPKQELQVNLGGSVSDVSPSPGNKG